MEKKISYTAAITELEKIVSEMEKGEIGVDALSEKVKRATGLIRVCRSKLTETEKDVNEILGEMKEE